MVAPFTGPFASTHLFRCATSFKETPLADHRGLLLLLDIITRGGEGAHAFLQGAGAHGRRSQGTPRQFFLRSSSRSLLF